MKQSFQGAKSVTKNGRHHVTVQNGNNTMETITKKFEKSVKLVTGKEVKKSYTTILPVFTTPADVAALLGENTAAFAAYGFRHFAKTFAANSVSGTGKKDKKLKASLRSFKTSLEVLISVMNMSQDVAVAALLAKEQFAGLSDYIKSLETVEDATTFDFTTSFPVPKLGEDEDEDETDEAESENS